MRKPITKDRSEMSINELIADSGWFNGTEYDWKQIPLAEREKIAFEKTGCKFAYATWEAPCDCAHTDCQIARGELPQIAKLNRILRGEAEAGWLKGLDRKVLAQVFRAYRSKARTTGEYDPWKLDWKTMVYVGLSA